MTEIAAPLLLLPVALQSRVAGAATPPARDFRDFP
jgi:hypothetical protein